MYYDPDISTQAQALLVQIESTLLASTEQTNISIKASALLDSCRQAGGMMLAVHLVLDWRKSGDVKTDAQALADIQSVLENYNKGGH